MKLIRYIAICLALCLSVDAMAEPAPKLAPAYQQDLNTIISLTTIESTLIEAFQKGVTESPSYTAEQRTALLNLTSDKGFVSRMHAMLLDQMAKGIPPADARNLAKTLQIPGVMKLINNGKNAAMDSNAELLLPTEEEKKNLQKLEKDKKQIASIQQLASALNSPNFTSSIQAFCLAELLPYIGTPTEQLAQDLDGKPAASSTSPAQVGAARDAFMAFFLRTKQANVDINQRYADTLKKLQIGNILSADVLSSLPNIDAALQALDGAEVALNQFKKEADMEVEQSTKEFQSLEIFKNAAPEIVASWESGVSKGYARRIAFQENQQKILTLYRRVLQFARTNNGKIRKQDTKLIFDTTEDLTIYNALLQQIKDAAAEENQMLKQSADLQKSLSQDLKKN